MVGTEPAGVGAILHASPAERRVREAGALAQEAPHFHAGVDALFEAPDELHDGAVPEEDRTVGLFGRERHRRVVLGQELVELSQGRRRDTEQLASRPADRTATGEELDHQPGECRLEQCVVEDTLLAIRLHVRHHRFPMPFLELLSFGARGEGQGERVALGAAVIQLRLHDDEERHGVGPPPGQGQEGHVVHHAGIGDRPRLLREPPARRQVAGQERLELAQRRSPEELVPLARQFERRARRSGLVRLLLEREPVEPVRAQA